MAVRSLIKRLLVYGKGRRQESGLLDKEEQEWQEEASTSQHGSEEESCKEELDRAIQMAECIYDLDEPDDLPESPKLVEFLCAEPDKPPPEVQDPLEVIDLGTKEDPRPIHISGLLGVDDRARIVCLLQEFKDCFAWHYTEMPGLDPALVEHRMPIKEGYKPVKQAPRRMSKEIEEKVKEEIERLVKAGFIRPAKYVEWLANIVLVLKVVTKAVRCCVDYRNINSATPKDEYPMPMADLSIDAVAKDKVLSFMDENAGYNQIKMAPEDIHKTAFRRAASSRPQASIDKDEDPQIEDESKEVRIWSESGQLLRIPGAPERCGSGQDKSRAIMESPPPANKVQLQRLLGKINFLRRFIANLAGKIQPLTPLLRLKDKENFEWGPPHQQAFDSIKAYLTLPPVLVPPQRGKPLKLYISASERSIRSLLAQNNEGGNEQAVYYLSRILTEVETRYSPVERLCLALYFTASKLRHYMLPCHVHIIAKTDVIKYMLSKPMLAGRIGKWILALSEFSFQYVPQRAVKGQAIADFLTEHQESQRYDALIIGLEILIDLGAAEVEIFGDSELVINQLNGKFKCRHITMAGYYMAATQLLSFWESEISVNHIPRGSNLAANEMAQLASRVPMQERKYGADVEIQTRNLPFILDRGFSLDVMVLETKMEDWRSHIIHHLKDPSSPTNKKNRQQATKYVLWAKNLLRKTPDGLLLKCLGQ
ncbi:unnamed protein product [Malus baccata var. baccata]